MLKSLLKFFTQTSEQPRGVQSRTPQSRIFFDRRINLFVINPDGSDAIRLKDKRTRDGICGRDVTCSPDGKWIAFSLNCSGHWKFGDEPLSDVARIWVRQPDGSLETSLTDPVDGQASNPQWSPDGKEIAYECYDYDSTNGGGSQIWVVNVANKLRRRIGSFNKCSKLVWPSTNELVFFNEFNDNYDHSGWLTILGNQVRKFGLAEKYEMWTISYSFDGSKIAFMGTNEGVRGLYVIDANGNNLRLLEKFGQYSWSSITWSPDSLYIAAVAVDIGGGRSPGDLYIFGVDGSGKRVLARGREDEEICSASWSPWL